jgi:hypothetical protein
MTQPVEVQDKRTIIIRDRSGMSVALSEAEAYDVASRILKQVKA